MIKTVIERMSSDEIVSNNICSECIHYKGGFPPKCEAYPREIPNEIYYNGFDHRKEFPGDQGIRFEKVK